MSNPISAFPDQYLGLPLTLGKILTSALLLVEKIKKKIPIWWASLLSHGDRLALVRHVLYAMPNHFLIAIAVNKSILVRGQSGVPCIPPGWRQGC